MSASPALRPVPYPPVLPLMHPALRGLCKPSQGLAIGLTAGTIITHDAALFQCLIECLCARVLLL